VVTRALLLLVVTACGAAGGRGGGATARREPRADRELVLYRDGALVRERREVEITGGAMTFAMPLPADVEAGAIVARVVDAGAGDAHVGALTVVTPTLVAGDRVEVRDGARAVRGVLRGVGDREVVLEEGGRTRIILDPQHVVRLQRGGASRRVDVQVFAARPGRAVIELAYVTRQLRWVADYTLVMDTTSRRAELHGALGIDDAAGVAYEDATITLVDAERPVKLTAFDEPEPEAATAKPPADPTKPRAEQPATLTAPKEMPRTTLPFLVDVRPGAQSVSLLAGSHVLPARQTLVYDPVGDARDHTGKVPLQAPSYGLDRTSSAVSQSIDVDLRARIPGGMPAGKVRLLERTAKGDLMPLGEARIFDRAGTGADQDTIAPTTSVAVGRAAGIEGKRRRRELSIDLDARRLVEEFEIELTNQADHAVEVIVREHLYRGQNWTLAYYSEPDVSKEGPQKIAMKAKVPAKGSKRVVYRVVYWW